MSQQTRFAHESFISRRQFLALAGAGGSLAGLGMLWRNMNDNAEYLNVPGVNEPLGKRRLFPDDNPWNRPIVDETVDPLSEFIIRSIGQDKSIWPDFGVGMTGTVYGIPYRVVPGKFPKVPVQFEYKGESDPGPYPVASDSPIEGGPKSKGDRHILTIDRDNWKLYELFDVRYDEAKNLWKAGSGAIFDLNSNNLRPAGWTSADAAGLPIFPGLIRYEEVFEIGEIRHALRFTCRKVRRAYLAPARHFVNKNKEPNLPPLGMRVRLRKSYDISKFSKPAQVILKALQQYGMFLADVGKDWAITGTADVRWKNTLDAELKKVKGREFEVVYMNPLDLTIG